MAKKAHVVLWVFKEWNVRFNHLCCVNHWERGILLFEWVCRKLLIITHHVAPVHIFLSFSLFLYRLIVLFSIETIVSPHLDDYLFLASIWIMSFVRPLVFTLVNFLSHFALDLWFLTSNLNLRSVSFHSILNSLCAYLRLSIICKWIIKNITHKKEEEADKSMKKYSHKLISININININVY